MRTPSSVTNSSERTTVCSLSLTIPGVSHYTALTVYAEVGEISRFYERLAGKKSAKEAIVATARKMLVSIYHPVGRAPRISPRSDPRDCRRGVRAPVPARPPSASLRKRGRHRRGRRLPAPAGGRARGHRLRRSHDRPGAGPGLGGDAVAVRRVDRRPLSVPRGVLPRARGTRGIRREPLAPGRILAATGHPGRRPPRLLPAVDLRGRRAQHGRRTRVGRPPDPPRRPHRRSPAPTARSSPHTCGGSACGVLANGESRPPGHSVCWTMWW